MYRVVAAMTSARADASSVSPALTQTGSYDDVPSSYAYCTRQRYRFTGYAPVHATPVTYVTAAVRALIHVIILSAFKPIRLRCQSER